MELVHDGIQHETDSALLFLFDEENVWIPKSLVEEYDDDTVEVEDWFVEENDLEGFQNE